VSEGRPKVLLVDDLPENLKALDAVLEPLDLELTHASSGTEALKCLLKDDFAVILLDVQMPELDGFETAALIKSRERTRDLPIIFVTAISRDTEHIYRGYSEGAVDYILKPYEPSVLRSKVKVFVELYRRGAALRESEDRFRTAFTNAPIGMALVRPDGRFLQVNRALHEMLGYSEQDLLATTLAAVTHPEDRDDDRALLQSLLRGERASYRHEKRYVRADASVLWVSFNVSVVPGEGGRPAHLVLQAEDITERRRADHERAERMREHAARVEAEAVTEVVRKVQRVTDAALAHLSLDDLLPELVGRIKEILNTDSASILIAEPEDEMLVVRAARGLPIDTLGFRVPLGQGFAGRVAAEKRPVVIDDVAQAEILNPALIESDARSLLGVPLIHEGQVTGVVHVGSKRRGAFDEDDVSVLQLIADRAALAVENARLYDVEHHIVETLQRSLLPERMPDLPGVALAARYLAGGYGADVGGDWYDAIALPSGDLAIAMGDVVGHGIGAAALMGQLRNALRAYVLDSHSPGEVVGRIDRLMHQFEAGRMATLLYMSIARDFSSLRYVSAGHLPPVVVEPDGTTRLLEGGRALPLGVMPQEHFDEGVDVLTAGSTLILYTDGLVERPGENLDDGIARLAHAATTGPPDPDSLADHLLAELIGSEPARDDVGLLVLRTLPLRNEDLRLELPADPKALMAMRHTLERWLAEAGATRDEASDIQLACHEAASNAIEHGYRFSDASFEVAAVIDDGSVTITVRDKGGWQKPEKTDRGRGFGMMKALMDDVQIKKGRGGTTVGMTRRLQRLPASNGGPAGAPIGEAEAGAGSSGRASRPKASPR
jgi:PAS domain S-box-containing protein